jgi:hypothetical protein
MFEPDEWKAAYILNRQKPPDKPPTLNEVLRLVALMDGFLARKGDGEPGCRSGAQLVQSVQSCSKIAGEPSGSVHHGISKKSNWTKTLFAEKF